MKITLTAMILVTIIMTIFSITILISKKTTMSREKNSPFECGFSNMSSARKPFSSHFFMIGILFLIFDIEISIILPLTNTSMTNMTEWLISSMMTMMILIAGLVNEWKTGMLEWTK
uniref:NADH-ubiquinone oxidoreductase chain 3 n=1 Tax=Pochazia shantungensis TaxID=2891616 RepID=A0A866UAR3_9HEMI|nr:NADH dehydrogenase subunit 3 [Pochazia shantungensis]QOE55908.1 NADH dehydrogenase subunit 3 [Pochazia shantungensis]QRI61355.1 NADH dehydrogenase subunit 3 [Pochazia shantungensis]